ncbi:MAG TPA: hypothetical protein VJN02_07975 [Gammaproteobacteria bacterium]|nr:hypothetical protein [Gammaproteobacteria bacterium]
MGDILSESQFKELRKKFISMIITADSRIILGNDLKFKRDGKKYLLIDTLKNRMGNYRGGYIFSSERKKSKSYYE